MQLKEDIEIGSIKFNGNELNELNFIDGTREVVDEWNQLSLQKAAERIATHLLWKLLNATRNVIKSR